jgi:hypothetical protein
LGREDKITTYKDTLEATLSITQMEYGDIASFLQLAGKSAEPAGGLALTDFSDTKTDFYLPGKDTYGGTVEQTLWLQKMVLDSFNLEMNAEERIQRTFELSGDFCKIARYGNKYLIFKTDTVGSGEDGSYDIVLSDPAPVKNPNGTDYILQLYRIRDGVATEMTSGYTFNSGTNTLTITAAVAADEYRIWYTAASYGTSGDPTELNDSDDYYIKADNVTVTIDDGTNDPVELTKLTSLSVQCTLNRIEEGVIGDNEKILREVESYDVSISLGGFVKDMPIQEALMRQAGQNWGIIDYSLFSTVDVIIKIYAEATKSTFRIGYKIKGCEFSSDSANFNSAEYADDSCELVSDNCLITETIGNL